MINIEILEAISLYNAKREFYDEMDKQSMTDQPVSTQRDVLKKQDTHTPFIVIAWKKIFQAKRQP